MVTLLALWFGIGLTAPLIALVLLALPPVLAPLVDGLQARGFCFKTLREHPDFQPWIAAHGG